MALRRVVLLQRYERAVLRLSDGSRRLLEAGMHWLPRGAELVSFRERRSGAVARRNERETERALDVRPRVLDVPPVALATRDRRYVLLACSVRVSVTDPLAVVANAEKGEPVLALAERIVMHNVGVAASQLDAARFLAAVEGDKLREFLLEGLAEVTAPLGN